MPNRSPTFYADCEIIIKAFEKGAAFSADPKSVYALSTTLISKGIANANSTDKQIGIQFEDLDRQNTTLGINEPGFTRTTFSNKDPSQPTASAAQKASKASQNETAEPPTSSGAEVSQGSETPYTDKAFDSLGEVEKCIPCRDRFAGAEMAMVGFGKKCEDWLELPKQNLIGILHQLEQMVEMFKDQGRSAMIGLCEFIKSFQLLQCPSDLMRIIGALSAALTKLSIDLLGDLGMFLSLAKGLLTPLFSAAIQLIQNFLQKIIDPIHCILDVFQKEMVGVLGDTMETISNLQGPWEVEAGLASTWKDADWSLTQVPGPATPSDSLLPDTSGPVGGHPFKTKPRDIYRPSYEQADSGSYEQYLKTEQEIRELEAAKPKLGSKQYKELKEKKSEFNEQKFNKTIKAIKDFNNDIDKVQNQFQNIFEATFTHLTSIATFMEEFYATWVEELSRLVGGSLVVEFGFAQKGVQKLSLITLVGTFLSLYDLIFKTEGGCDAPADVLENIIQAQFKGTDLVIRKEEDGTLTVFDKIETDVESSSPTPQYSFASTGDEEIDIKIQDLAKQIEEPAPAISFHCRNSVPQDADTNQIYKWIAELEAAGI